MTSTASIVDRPKHGFEAPIGRWLTDNLQKEGQGKIGIIHGDYQWGNVMFSMDRPVITGLVDWELSTLGNPLADFTYVLIDFGRGVCKAPTPRCEVCPVNHLCPSSRV